MPARVTFPRQFTKNDYASVEAIGGRFDLTSARRHGGVHSMHSIQRCIFVSAAFGFVAAFALAQEPLVTLVTTTVGVNVSQPWTDTGVVITSRTPFRITATGWIDVSLFSRKLLSPNGDPACKGNLGTPRLAPSLPCWALVGRIGGGEPFFVGRSATIEPDELGPLFLGVNDELVYFADNFGQWTASISVAPDKYDPAVAPNPAALLEDAKVLAAIKSGFEGVESSTILARIATRTDWKTEPPSTEQLLPPGVVVLASKLDPADGIEKTDSALRQGVRSLETLIGNDYGRNAKAFLARVLLEAVAEALPTLAPSELANLSEVLQRTAREGLSPEVRTLLVAGKRPAYLLAASSRPSSTVRLRGQDDLLMVRYRAMEGSAHVYDVLATWSEEARPGAKETVYGDVRLADGQQGYARHRLAIAVDADGKLQVKPPGAKPFYSASQDAIWPRGDLTALK
jgi:hypothetical protein